MGIYTLGGGFHLPIITVLKRKAGKRHCAEVQLETCAIGIFSQLKKLGKTNPTNLLEISYYAACSISKS